MAGKDVGDDVLGKAVLQDGDGHLRAAVHGCEQLLAGLVLAVGVQQSLTALGVVRDGELDLLGSLGADGHELEADVHVAVDQVRNALVRGLLDELDLFRIAEERVGNDLRHGDVEAAEVAVVVIEVPRGVGAAGADDQITAIEDFLQLAAAAGSAAVAAAAACRAGGDHQDGHEQRENGSELFLHLFSSCFYNMKWFSHHFSVFARGFRGVVPVQSFSAMISISTEAFVGREPTPMALLAWRPGSP